MDKPFRKIVPSLTSLVALDAAARHRSFTRAAEELGVTQTAVSRQIMYLESELGSPLFIRRHRAIEPTPECLRLAGSLNKQFAAIANSISDFKASAADGAITIGATIAFTQLWLLPRLVEFRRIHPKARIRLRTTDEPISLDRGDVDVVIRYGKSPFSDGTIVASQSDSLFPVSSPDYAERLGEFADSFWKGDYELISTESDQPKWYTWQDWFEEVGVARSKKGATLSFNDYTGSLYAARSGEGIALAWGLLVRTFLTDGTLVRLGQHELNAEGQFHIVVSRRSRQNLIVDLFIEWLASELGTQARR
jgi:LysR family glycine cleavage system transcriptional activator